MKFKEETSLKKAVVINAVSKYSKVIINVLFTVVLARLLSPEDYGIVAVVTVFTSFFSIFADLGFGTAVIQNKELSEEDTNSIYTFSIYLGLFLGILFVIFSYPMSVFYNNEVYFPIGCVLAISLVFNTFNMIPNAVIMKNKQFMLIGIRTIVLSIISGILTVFFAVLGFKYYALVISSVISAVVTYFWNMGNTNLKFLGKVRKESIQKVLSFSFFQFAFSFVNYFARNLDNLLTGKFIGSAALGYYNKAYNLMQYPTSNLTHVITPALHPILSEYQNDKRTIYKQYMKVVKLLAIIGVFVSAFCYFASDEIIHIMYGETWNRAIPCFKWLSISVWAQMITSSVGAIFQSLGDTKRMFWAGSVNAILNVVAIILGITTGSIEKLSICIAISYCIHFIISFFVLIKLSFGMSYVNFLKGLWKELVIGILLVLAIVIYPFNFENIFVSVCVKAVVMLVVYFIGLILTGEISLLKKMIKK